MKRVLPIVATLSLVLLAPLFSASNPYKIPDAVDEGIRQTFTDLFNQDFERIGRTSCVFQPVRDTAKSDKGASIKSLEG